MSAPPDVSYSRSIRSRLALAGRERGRRGRAAGTGGKVSALDNELCWIRPSGKALGELRAFELCSIRLRDDQWVQGRSFPSTEWSTVYRTRPDVRAIFHTHSPCATGLATSSADFGPLLGESIGYLGDIVAVPYQFRSTEALASSIEDALYRFEIIEEVAHALVSAHTAGVSRFFMGQIVELKNLSKVPPGIRSPDLRPAETGT